MLGDFLGLSRLGDPPAQSTTRTAPPSHESRAFEMRLDALELACAGLWRLLKEHHGYTDDQLVAWIEHVDAEDGKKDGKRTVRGETCPQCNRPALTRAKGQCLWCGAAMRRQPL